MSAEETKVVAEAKLPAVKLPEPVERRGITDAEWRTLKNNLFPGATNDSVLMVWDYCTSRKLDPLKKPCHIVPMEVKTGKHPNGDDKYEWRDVVMPGIYEYRMTATRTGQYLGHSKPIYGEIIEYKGVQVPRTCEITVYRWNSQAQMRCEFPVQLIFTETCATKRNGDLNRRWKTAPRQMFTKCVEAAALREAFPDELGGTHTVDEMEGRELEPINVTPEPARIAIDPRPDTSGIPKEWTDEHVSAIADIIGQSDKERAEVSEELNEYVNEFLARKHELYTAVLDQLKDQGIIAKGKFRELLNVANNTRAGHQ